MSDVTPIRPEPEDLRPAEQKELDEASIEVAHALQESLPHDCSFALFIYRPNGATKYVSSGELADVDAVITRWRAKVFGRPEPVRDESRFLPAVGENETRELLDTLYNELGFNDADRVRAWIREARDLARAAQPGRPRPGDRRYSKYFRANIELVTYTDDKHWTFHVDGAPAGSFLPNQTPWSKMPPAKE